MTAPRPLRIAILTHSTNPRGGVVHALELGDALTRLGHEAVVHAPDAKGDGFFRPDAVRNRSASPLRPPAPISTRRWWRPASPTMSLISRSPRIGASMSFTPRTAFPAMRWRLLKERGLIGGFRAHRPSCRRLCRRTPGGFADPRDPRRRSTLRRQPLMARLSGAQTLAVNATIVGNGVDRLRFSPSGRRAGSAAARAFWPGRWSDFPRHRRRRGAQEHASYPRSVRADPRISRADAQLLIAGGASLLDHGDYQARFRQRFGRQRTVAGAVAARRPACPSRHARALPYRRRAGVSLRQRRISASSRSRRSPAAFPSLLRGSRHSPNISPSTKSPGADP